MDKAKTMITASELNRIPATTKRYSAPPPRKARGGYDRGDHASKKKSLNVRWPDEMWRELEILRDASGQPMCEVVRRLVRIGMDKDK